MPKSKLFLLENIPQETTLFDVESYIRNQLRIGDSLSKVWIHPEDSCRAVFLCHHGIASPDIKARVCNNPLKDHLISVSAEVETNFIYAAIKEDSKHCKGLVDKLPWVFHERAKGGSKVKNIKEIHTNCFKLEFQDGWDAVKKITCSDSVWKCGDLIVAVTVPYFKSFQQTNGDKRKPVKEVKECDAKIDTSQTNKQRVSEEASKLPSPDAQDGSATRPDKNANSAICLTHTSYPLGQGCLDVTKVTKETENDLAVKENEATFRKGLTESPSIVVKPVFIGSHLLNLLKCMQFKEKVENLISITQDDEREEIVFKGLEPLVNKFYDLFADLLADMNEDATFPSSERDLETATLFFQNQRVSFSVEEQEDHLQIFVTKDGTKMYNFQEFTEPIFLNSGDNSNLPKSSTLHEEFCSLLVDLSERKERDISWGQNFQWLQMLLSCLSLTKRVNDRFLDVDVEIDLKEQKISLKGPSWIVTRLEEILISLPNNIGLEKHQCDVFQDFWGEENRDKAVKTHFVDRNIFIVLKEANGDSNGDLQLFIQNASGKEITFHQFLEDLKKNTKVFNLHSEKHKQFKDKFNKDNPLFHLHQTDAASCHLLSFCFDEQTILKAELEIEVEADDEEFKDALSSSEFEISDEKALFFNKDHIKKYVEKNQNITVKRKTISCESKKDFDSLIKNYQSHQGVFELPEWEQYCHTDAVKHVIADIEKKYMCTISRALKTIPTVLSVKKSENLLFYVVQDDMWNVPYDGFLHITPLESENISTNSASYQTLYLPDKKGETFRDRQERKDELVSALDTLNEIKDSGSSRIAISISNKFKNPFPKDVLASCILNKIKAVFQECDMEIEIYLCEIGSVSLLKAFQFFLNGSTEFEIPEKEVWRRIESEVQNPAADSYTEGGKKRKIHQVKIATYLPGEYLYYSKLICLPLEDQLEEPYEHSKDMEHGLVYFQNDKRKVKFACQNWGPDVDKSIKTIIEQCLAEGKKVRCRYLYIVLPGIQDSSSEIKYPIHWLASRVFHHLDFFFKTKRHLFERDIYLKVPNCHEKIQIFEKRKESSVNKGDKRFTAKVTLLQRNDWRNQYKDMKKELEDKLKDVIKEKKKSEKKTQATTQQTKALKESGSSVDPTFEREIRSPPQERAFQHANWQRFIPKDDTWHHAKIQATNHENGSGSLEKDYSIPTDDTLNHEMHFESSELTNHENGSGSLEKDYSIPTDDTLNHPTFEREIRSPPQERAFQHANRQRFIPKDDTPHHAKIQATNHENGSGSLEKDYSIPTDDTLNHEMHHASSEVTNHQNGNGSLKEKDDSLESNSHSSKQQRFVSLNQEDADTGFANQETEVIKEKKKKEAAINSNSIHKADTENANGPLKEKDFSESICQDKKQSLLDSLNHEDEEVDCAEKDEADSISSRDGQFNYSRSSVPMEVQNPGRLDSTEHGREIKCDTHEPMDMDSQCNIEKFLPPIEDCQWFYCTDSADHEPFYYEESTNLENAYRNGEKTIFVLGLRINLSTMEAYGKEDGCAKYRILRKEALGEQHFKKPDTWTEEGLAKLKTREDEYKEIKRKICNSLSLWKADIDQDSFKFEKIERIQNKKLFNFYMRRKKEASSDPKEMWQRIDHEDKDLLLNLGCQKSFFQVKCDALGDGICLAQNVTACLTPEDRDEEKIVVLVKCLVLLDEDGKGLGKAGLRFPPMNMETNKLVSSVSNEKYFMVFDSYKIFPTHFVTLKGDP